MNSPAERAGSSSFFTDIPGLSTIAPTSEIRQAETAADRTCAKVAPPIPSRGVSTAHAIARTAAPISRNPNTPAFFPRAWKSTVKACVIAENSAPHEPIRTIDTAIAAFSDESDGKSSETAQSANAKSEA